MGFPKPKARSSTLGRQQTLLDLRTRASCGPVGHWRGDPDCSMVGQGTLDQHRFSGTTRPRSAANGIHLSFFGKVFEYPWNHRRGLSVFSKWTIHSRHLQLARIGHTRLGTMFESTWSRSFERSPHNEICCTWWC